MESFMPTTSWQTSSSAEYYNCRSPQSPGSSVPSPSSPTLYLNNSKDEGIFQINESSTNLGLFKDDLTTSARSQLATTLLQNIEEYENIEQFQVPNEFGTDWSDDTVNLELFNELSALEYIVPTTPTSGEVENQIELADFDDQDDIANESEVELYDQLSTEFQSILDSLPRTARVDNFPEELIDLSDLIFNTDSGVQQNILQAPALLTFTPSVIQHNGKSQENVKQESKTKDVEGENDEVFMEIDVTNASAELGTTYQYLSIDDSTSSLLSCSSTCTTEDEDDLTLLSDEKMLDALLVGNLEKAITLLPGVSLSATNCLNTFVSDDTRKAKKTNPIKTPKPTKKSTYKRKQKKAPKIEKVIRKKEQNKTAALRYRMKKKIEIEVTLEREGELQAEHDRLMKEKEDVSRQVQMVKQLLRDVFAARKKSCSKRL